MASIQRVAGFDIGTNSVRVLVADVDNLSRIVAGFRLGFAVRLGEGLSSTGRVSEEALERTSRVLGKSALLARRLGASNMLAGATHALRVAENAGDVVRALEEAAGFPIRVLTLEEEAYYVYTGALSESFSFGAPLVAESRGGIADGSMGLSKSPQEGLLAGAVRVEVPFQGGFVMDVGGGSTSIIHGSSNGTIRSCLFPLGCVTLTERFLKRDPPAPEELQTLGEHVTNELAKAQCTVFPEAHWPVIGVGGAVTSISAVSLGLSHYESKRIEGHILTREEIERCAQRLSRLTLEERIDTGALERRRAEIAVAGAVVLSLLTIHLGVKRLTVSTRGLRYGLALEAAAHPAG